MLHKSIFNTLPTKTVSMFRTTKTFDEGETGSFVKILHNIGSMPTVLEDETRGRGESP